MVRALRRHKKILVVSLLTVFFLPIYVAGVVFYGGEFHGCILVVQSELPPGGLEDITKTVADQQGMWLRDHGTSAPSSDGSPSVFFEVLGLRSSAFVYHNMDSPKVCFRDGLFGNESVKLKVAFEKEFKHRGIKFDFESVEDREGELKHFSVEHYQ